MASRSIKICDWCKKEVEHKGSYPSKEGWKTVNLEFGQYNHKYFDLCPECLEKLGIVGENKREKDIEQPTTYGKLFEIISDIVNDAIDNR